MQRFASVVTAILVTACASTSDEDVPDALTEPAVNGVDATASVSEIITNSSPPTPFPKIQFNVKVTLSNTTASAKTVTYRAACSVRMQLRAADDSNLYDEATRDCDPGLASITIPGQSQQILNSGIRFPTSVLGDSLQPGRYRVVAVFQTDNGALHIEAGNYSIPFCDNLGCRAPGAGGGPARK